MNRDEVIKKLKETRARLKYQGEAIDRAIAFVENEPAVHYITGLFHNMVREEIDSKLTKPLNEKLRSLESKEKAQSA